MYILEGAALAPMITKGFMMLGMVFNPIFKYSCEEPENVTIYTLINKNRS